MEKLLTVVITTYNRKQLLLETLRSFERQKLFEYYAIVISNNCSDYNIDEWLSKNLSPDFLDIITIYNRPYNVGGDVNIAFTFQLCYTKWMWIMSDDDLVNPSSLRTVLNDINRYPNVTHIKYSLDGFKALPDKTCFSFGEVLDTFLGKEIENGSGQFIFMSNNIVNITKTKDYIGKAPYYANTCVPHLIPSIFSISNDENNAVWKISSESITNCRVGNCFYDQLYAVVNLTNIPLIDADFSNEDIYKIKKLFVLSERKAIIKSLVKVKSSKKRNILFRKILNGYYPKTTLNSILFYLYYKSSVIKSYI